jgi:hypothetical protein
VHQVLQDGYGDVVSIETEGDKLEAALRAGRRDLSCESMISQCSKTRTSRVPATFSSRSWRGSRLHFFIEKFLRSRYAR